jgi:hypothetical protein
VVYIEASSPDGHFLGAPLSTAPSQINAVELTTYDVDPDGHFVRLHVRDHAGHLVTLILPTECLTQLLMSLPGMVQKALRNRHGDDSLRLAHPLESFNVEVGETSATGTRQYILTLATAGGFAVSFSGSDSDLASLGGAISSDVVPLPEPSNTVRRLS